PVERRGRASGLDEDAVLDQAPVGQAERPAWPRLGGEALDALGAVGVNDVRRVALRGEGYRPARGLDPRLKPVHQHDAAGGRGGRGEEERVVAPCADPTRRTRGEAAEAVGLEPLGAAMRK